MTFARWRPKARARRPELPNAPPNRRALRFSRAAPYIATMTPPFPHDLFLVFRANMQRLRDTVKTAPLAVVFGGGPDLAGCLLRVNDALDSGIVNAPNLVAIALDSPEPAPESDLADLSDDELVSSCEAALRQLLDSGAFCSCGACAPSVSMVLGARQIAFGFVIRMDPSEPPANDVIRASMESLGSTLVEATGRLAATFTEL